MRLLFRSVVTILFVSFTPLVAAASFSFTGLSGVPANGYSSTVDGITVTITTPTTNHRLAYFNAPGWLGLNGLDGIGAEKEGLGGLLDPADVQQGEALTVSFSETVTIASITLGHWDFLDRVTLSSAGGNSTLAGDSCHALTVACLTESFDLSSIGAINSFTLTGDSFFTAFVLAGLKDVQATAVPLPATGWLFVSGLLSLAGRKYLLR